MRDISLFSPYMACLLDSLFKFHLVIQDLNYLPLMSWSFIQVGSLGIYRWKKRGLGTFTGGAYQLTAYSLLDMWKFYKELFIQFKQGCGWYQHFETTPECCSVDNIFLVRHISPLVNILNFIHPFWVFPIIAHVRI